MNHKVMNLFTVFAVILCSVTGTMNLTAGATGMSVLCFFFAALNGHVLVKKIEILEEQRSSNGQ